MKPILKRKDVVEVQSRVYMNLPGGGRCSVPAGTRGTIIDFFAHTTEAYEGVSVEVGIVAIVRMQKNELGGPHLDVTVNERALKLVHRRPRTRARAVKQARKAASNA